MGGLVAWTQRNRLLDVVESLCGSTSRECSIEWDFLELVREIDLVTFELDLQNPIVMLVDYGVFIVAGRVVVSCVVVGRVVIGRVFLVVGEARLRVVICGLTIPSGDSPSSPRQSAGFFFLSA